MCFLSLQFSFKIMYYPPASEASREVANLIEGKNWHTPPYMASKNLSVCLSMMYFDVHYLQQNRMG